MNFLARLFGRKESKRPAGIPADFEIKAPNGARPPQQYRRAYCMVAAVVWAKILQGWPAPEGMNRFISNTHKSVTNGEDDILTIAETRLALEQQGVKVTVHRITFDDIIGYLSEAKPVVVTLPWYETDHLDGTKLPPIDYPRAFSSYPAVYAPIGSIAKHAVTLVGYIWWNGSRYLVAQLWDGTGYKGKMHIRFEDMRAVLKNGEAQAYYVA